MQPGICIQIYDADSLPKTTPPEILRSPIYVRNYAILKCFLTFILQSLCLSIMNLSLAPTVAEILMQAPTPPDASSVQEAMHFLRQINAGLFSIRH